MSNKILHDVSCVDYMYPCATYAKRRLNLDISAEDLMEMSGTPYDKETSTLEVGDIIVWVRKNTNTAFSDIHPLTIENNICLSSKVYENKHLGVYEGDGLVSDFTCLPTPRLRFMKLSKRFTPTAIIKRTSIQK